MRLPHSRRCTSLDINLRRSTPGLPRTLTTPMRVRITAAIDPVMGPSFLCAFEVDTVPIMGANIVRRRPPTSSPQPAQTRTTAELTEYQLHDLLRDDAPGRFERAPEDLEAELELVSARPAVLPDATPTSLPRRSSPRLAHTLPRVPYLGGEPATQLAPTRRPAALSPIDLLPRPTPAPTRRPAPPPRPPLTTQPAPAALVDSAGMSMPPLPRAARPASLGTALPAARRPVRFPAATPFNPEHAVAAPEAAPSPVTRAQAPLPVDDAPNEPGVSVLATRAQAPLPVDDAPSERGAVPATGAPAALPVDGTPSEPGGAVSTPERSRGLIVRRVRWVLPIMLLLIPPTVMMLLLR
jgi:hypothetical protein